MATSSATRCGAACDLRTVLDLAGVQAGATQIVGRSVDGFTAGFPTDWAMDRAGAMIALGDERRAAAGRPRLPARLIIPGLYGYVRPPSG